MIDASTRPSGVPTGEPVTPWLDDGDVRIYLGDALEVLRQLPDESVDCVVTSPPYWGLRDYGTGTWEGGNPDCDHVEQYRDPTKPAGSGGVTNKRPDLEERQTASLSGRKQFRDVCAKCGARRFDRQLGLEPTPDLFVQNMVEVFREVRRVLAPHGTCWVNLGDSYNSRLDGSHGGWNGSSPEPRAVDHRGPTNSWSGQMRGLPQKNLMGMPWRVAFGLQADGWILRSDIIWAKPNPMPESMTDRPTKAHEFVFLLTKAPWKGRVPGPIESALTPEDARWLALLLDAEGNICVKRVAPQEGKSPQYGAQVAIGSTSRALLERVVEITGVGNINERAGTNAPMFYWQVSNKVAQDLLYAVYPHLIVKPRQARIAIHVESLLYHRGKATHRTDAENSALESLWQRNKACNQFGEPDLSDVPAPRYGRWGPSRYFFDQEAVREDATWDRWSSKQTTPKHTDNGNDRYASFGREWTEEELERYRAGGRNVRSVWTIATQPYPEAHFATFPEELARRCIVAGCPVRVCRVCGKPSERIVDVSYGKSPAHGKGSIVGSRGVTERDATHMTGGMANKDSIGGQPRIAKIVDTVGWSDCGHNAYRPGAVLDPFIGSGTVAKVARDHQRHAVGIDLNETYLDLAARRLQQLSLLNEAQA